MKKSAILKQLIFTSLLIGGMNVLSSCNGCSRKTESTEENTTIESFESSSEDDTISSGDDSGTINDGSTTSASINATSNSGSGKSGSNAGTTKTSATTTSAPANNAKKEEARQQAITDMVENSDAKSAVDKNGKPIRSSGDAGTGSGTGTGSTGNNSRVTTREAQKAN